MAGQRVSRLRKVALTGALTPGLILGAAGFGILPGGILPTGVTAQSVVDCVMFAVGQPRDCFIRSLHCEQLARLS